MWSNFQSLFVLGTAGCVATLLHDAIMNPAEGKEQSKSVRDVCAGYTELAKRAGATCPPVTLRPPNIDFDSCLWSTC